MCLLFYGKNADFLANPIHGNKTLPEVETVDNI